MTAEKPHTPHNQRMHVTSSEEDLRHVHIKTDLTKDTVEKLEDFFKELYTLYKDKMHKT